MNEGDIKVKVGELLSLVNFDEDCERQRCDLCAYPAYVKTAINRHLVDGRTVKIEYRRRHLKKVEILAHKVVVCRFCQTSLERRLRDMESWASYAEFAGIVKDGCGKWYYLKKHMPVCDERLFSAEDTADWIISRINKRSKNLKKVIFIEKS